MTNLLAEINKRFFEKLETKTAWGKNECKAMYQTICTEVMSAALSQVDTSHVVFPEAAREVIPAAGTSFQGVGKNPHAVGEKSVIVHNCDGDETHPCSICGLKSDEVF